MHPQRLNKQDLVPNGQSQRSSQHELNINGPPRRSLPKKESILCAKSGAAGKQKDTRLIWTQCKTGHATN